MLFHCYNLTPKIKSCQIKKQDFILRKTNSSLILKVANSTFVETMPFMKNKHLYLFQAVKKEILQNIEKNNILIEEFKYSDILYFSFNREAISKFTECLTVVEYDITKAYLTAAKNLKFISEEFYKKVIELPKKIRLIILGSIASTATINTYKNGELINTETKNNALLTKVWKMICKYVGDTMKHFLLMPSYLFFWVDGIFFDYSKNTIEEIETRVNSIKVFEFKKINCLSLRKQRNSIVVIKEDNIKKQFYTNYKR